MDGGGDVACSVEEEEMTSGIDPQLSSSRDKPKNFAVTLR